MGPLKLAAAMYDSFFSVSGPADRGFVIRRVSDNNPANAPHGQQPVNQTKDFHHHG
jgi:hypothetical protein